MSLPRLLARWRADPQIAGQVVEWRTLPARPAQLGPLPAELHPALAAALHGRGISALYSHQTAAWQAVQAGQHVAVVAGTASGKTLCYNLPILQRSLDDPAARALYLFPTKALTQDQLAGLHAWGQALAGHSLAAAVYDGDTSARNRRSIRSTARLLLTNPDMLHLGILPHHTDWAEFFSHLHYVVIDEAHTYRGVFGSHLANVLRRLGRIARFYGSQPQFLLTTATLANPDEFTRRLIEAPVTVIEQDGAPRGPRHFLIYNPPLIDADLGLRRSALHESVRLTGDLLAQNVQTIVFARSRRSTELLLTYLRELQQDPAAPAPAGNSGPSDTIRGYRSGYLPQQRREIERGLRDGQVRVVAATNALELGIDIGGMGAVVLVGYPGSVASTWQQAGRAGRGLEAALAVLVATPNPLDQFLAAHPDYFFGRSPEHALLDANNLLILLDHLRCAAFELPFQHGEGFGQLPPERTQEFLDFLVDSGALHHSGAKYFWIADAYPAQAVSLRSASADPIMLQVQEAPDLPPRVIGTLDRSGAYSMAHPQAIYLHEAQSYFVAELDLEHSLARLRPTQVDYYTQPVAQTEVQLVEQTAQADAPGAVRAQGELLVRQQVVGFKKIRWHSHEMLSQEPLDLPPSELLTTGYWLALTEAAVEALRAEGLWRNDPNNYGPLWPLIREQVRQRDGGRCQICGAAEGARQHDIHHKVPFRLFNDPRQANALDNLTTLCHDCHQRAEAGVRVRSGLAGLAYVLGNLAPFFLMCDSGDLGVTADPQAALAGGQPAVILYDQIPGGIGLSGRLFDLHSELVARAHELVAACVCSDGCPACTGPGGSGLLPPGEADYGGKLETLAILRQLL